MNEPQKESQQQESDFHTGGGHKIPSVIKIAWILFFIYLFVYSVVYLVPDLKDWL